MLERVEPKPKPPVTVIPQWISATTEDLTNTVMALPWQRHTIRGTPVPRLECFLGRPGDVYRYSGTAHHALDIATIPNLVHLMEMVNEITVCTFNSVFANLYRNERDSIGWHRDNEHELGPARDVMIASLSFGVMRRFLVREADDHSNTHEYNLANGDLLVMGPGCQVAWEHSLPKSKDPCGPRVSLTFRRMV